LLDLAREINQISEKQRTIIENWAKDPMKWDEKHKQDILESRKNIQKRVAEILLEIEAVTLKPNQPYRLVSGIISPIYTDNRLLMSYPKEREEIINAMVDIIENQIGLENIDIIAGTATSGIPHAAWLAERLDLPMVYINKEPSKFEKKTQIEGVLEKGKKVLLVEDLASTGGSSISAVKVIKEHGGIVKDCLVIFTYGMKKAKETFSSENVNLISLTDFSTMIDIAAQTNYIKDTDKEKVLEWAQDPAGWGPKHGFPLEEKRS